MSSIKDRMAMFNKQPTYTSKYRKPEKKKKKKKKDEEFPENKSKASAPSPAPSPSPTTTPATSTLPATSTNTTTALPSDKKACVSCQFLLPSTTRFCTQCVRNNFI